MLKAQGTGVREIARRLGRDPSTISRELRRNAATREGSSTTGRRSRSGKPSCCAAPKTAKLVTDDRLREYVQERLSGEVRRLDGTPVSGPVSPRGRAATSRGVRTGGG